MQLTPPGGRDPRGEVLADRKGRLCAPLKLASSSDVACPARVLTAVSRGPRLQSDAFRASLRFLSSGALAWAHKRLRTGRVRGVRGVPASSF